MEQFIQNYGIYILVLLYIFINIFYSNVQNILIFLVSFIVSSNFISNLNNSIVVAYIISIVFGIFKNFHLLENFESFVNNKKGLNNIQIDNIYNEQEEEKNIKILKQKTEELDKLEKLIKNKDSISKLDLNKLLNYTQTEDKKYNNEGNKEDDNNEDDNKEYNKNIKIEQLLSDHLLKKYIEHLKDIDIDNVKYVVLNLNNLKSSKSKLKKEKIDALTQIILKKNSKNKKNKNVLNLSKNIIISNDNFIIDGHHNWYAAKNILKNYNNKLPNKVNVIMIDKSIRNLIKDVKKFKETYNTIKFDDFNFDSNKVNKIKYNLDVIKKSVNNLEKYYSEIKKIGLI